MSKFRSIALALVVTQGVGDVIPADARASARIEYTDTPADVVELAEWAVGLYDEAGLELPSVEFRFHGEDVDGCDGHEGLHRPGDAQHVIELCRADDYSLGTQLTILHEFAHAWIAHGADQSARDAFRELRGFDHWNDRDTPWHENGVEQAAEIVVWGLVDRPIGVARITQNSCDELDAGFVALTGRSPLHGLRERCR